jgi:hypothetical protein
LGRDDGFGFYFFLGSSRIFLHCVYGGNGKRSHCQTSVKLGSWSCLGERTGVWVRTIETGVRGGINWKVRRIWMCGRGELRLVRFEHPSSQTRVPGSQERWYQSSSLQHQAIPRPCSGGIRQVMQRLCWGLEAEWTLGLEKETAH